jgi:hypothetical protein
VTLSVFVTLRSAVGVTSLVAVAELLPVIASVVAPVGVTVAVLAMLPTAVVATVPFTV